MGRTRSIQVQVLCVCVLTLAAAARGQGAEQVPVAIAATSTPVIAAGGKAILDGSGSSDADSDISKFLWTITSKTNPGQPPVVVPTSNRTVEVILTEPGEYDAALVVTDDDCEEKTSDDTSDSHVTIKVVKVRFNPTSVTVAAGATVPVTATITPESAVGDVAFGVDDTPIATVDKKKLAASPGGLIVAGVKAGATTLRAEITTGSGSVTVGTAAVTVAAPVRYLSILGKCPEAAEWPARFFIDRNAAIPIKIRAVNVAAGTQITYTLRSQRVPSQTTAVTAGDTAVFDLQYPQVGEYAEPDHVEIMAKAGAAATKTVFYSEVYPLRIVLSINPDPDINCDRDRVDLRIGAGPNEPGNKVIADISPWHDDLKDAQKEIIRFGLAGPNHGEAGQPIVKFAPELPSGPSTKISPRATDESKPGVTNLAAYLTPTCENERKAASIPLYVWGDGNDAAWVEGRKFNPLKAIVMPKPDALPGQGPLSYQLLFMAQREGGDCSHNDLGNRADTWKFSWTVLDNPPGFTVAPKTTEPDNRSVVKGQITNDLKPGTYTVKVITERTRTPFRDRTPYTQDFEFVQGNLKPKRKLVLAGGCDDENDRIHGTDLEFKIGGKLPLDEMRLEDNQGLFVNRNRAPYVKKNASDEWFFCSSDLVRKLHAEPVFNIGAYVKIPLLREQAIRVAHTAVAQTSGAFEALKILQPEDGRIYPNGAIQVQTEYTFDKAPAPHLVTGTISKGEAGPIHPSMRKSTYDKEFAFRGNPSGTAGFTADIIKKIPAQDDPANSLYGTVEVVLTDTRLFDLDDNNAPLALRQSVKVTGAEPSFWRNKLGGGRSGTYWNWATIIDPLADGRSFQIGSQAYGGKFGESGSWPGSKTNYNDKVRPADDTLEKLDALQRELAEAETRVLNLEPSWERSKRRLQEAITDYQQFVRALELVQTLKNLREEIKQRLIRLAAIEIELAELKRKPNPAPEDMERISQLEEERKRIREELDVRNRDYKRLLREILNIMKAFSPALLLEKSRESIIEAEFLRGQFEVPLGLAGVELEKARRLAQFILLLITTTEEDRLKQETVDPDETLKRRHLLNMLEDLKLEARARKLEAAATDAINAIKLLKDEVKVLREAEKVASKSVVLQAFGELLNTVTGRLLRLIGADKLADIILELLESLLGKFNVDAKEDLDRVVTAANNLIGRIEKIFDKSKETLAAGKELAKKAEIPYRVWITPTVEFPLETLAVPGNTPVPGW